MPSQPNTFLWSVGQSNTFPQCLSQTFNLVELSPPAQHAAPYTVWVLPTAGGIPFVQQLPNTLSFSMPYPVGTSVIVTLTDAQGRSGGVSNPISVTAGANSACLSQVAGSTALTLTSPTLAAGTSISACTPITFNVAGGTPPYTIYSMSANADSYVATDSSPTGSAQASYNFADPSTNGTTVTFFATDAKATWSRVLTTAATGGNAPLGCPGSANVWSTGSDSTNVAAIAGGAAGGGLAVALIALAIFFCLRRRRRIRAQSTYLQRPRVDQDEYGIEYFATDTTEVAANSPRRHNHGYRPVSTIAGTSPSLVAPYHLADVNATRLSPSPSESSEIVGTSASDSSLAQLFGHSANSDIEAPSSLQHVGSSTGTSLPPSMLLSGNSRSTLRYPPEKPSPGPRALPVLPANDENEGPANDAPPAYPGLH